MSDMNKSELLQSGEGTPSLGASHEANAEEFHQSTWAEQ